MLITKSNFIRTLLCGKPSFIIENGTLNQREMCKNRLTLDELAEELRMQGYPDLTAVKYAILETNGQLSVLPYAAQAPATPAQRHFARGARSAPGHRQRRPSVSTGSDPDRARRPLAVQSAQEIGADLSEAGLPAHGG